MTLRAALFTACLASGLSGAVLAQSQPQLMPQSVESVAAMIEELARGVEAAEARPFGEGSEGAAQARLDDLSAVLAIHSADISAAEAKAAEQIALIAAAMPAFPEALAQNEPPPEQESVDPAPPVSVPNPGLTDTAQAAPPVSPGSERQGEGPQVEAAVQGDPGAAPFTNTALPRERPSLADLTEPLDYEDRARRVLSRPGAEMQDDNGARTTLPSFSVLYVFAEVEGDGGQLLAVGRNPRRAEGWVEGARTEDWRTMLVMSYAPNTGRDRTVFFADVEDVLDILDLEEGAAGQMDRIRKQIAEGSHDPDRIVAIEPALTVNSVERPYLMPVIDYVRTNTDTHGDITILKLAALNRDSTDVALAGSQPVGEDRMSTQADARDFKVGVAFVIDTTRSMGPYIERAKGFVHEISTGLRERGLEDRFDFALVGYRDNVDAARDVEYLRRVYRDFGVQPEGVTLADSVDGMQPAQSSTANWREDAFAGIDLAIEGLNWGEVDTRLVFLITDASPRSVGDALASDSQMGPETINALASQRNISLFVLHMQTEEAATVSRNTEGYDDTERGRTLYGRLSRTGDAAISKYFTVQGQTEQAFEDSLGLVAGLVIDQLSQLSMEGRLQRPSEPLEDPLIAALSAGGPVVVDEEVGAPLVAAAVAGELFRYQTEYLGARSGVEAPDFYRAWAADIDLAHPERRALSVSVFVTREQLSDLANRLDDILSRLRQKELGMGDFFSSVQAEAGQTAVDPTIGSFLPGYLDDLPYGSTFINMTPLTWDALGEISRTQLLDEVEAKLASYRRIYSTQDGWITLDQRSSEDQVYPLPLRDLP